MFHKALRFDAGVVAGPTASDSIRPARPGELTVQSSTTSPPKNTTTVGAADPRPLSFGAQGRRRTKLFAVAVVAIVVVAVLGGYVLSTTKSTGQTSSGPPSIVPVAIYKTIPGLQFDAVGFVAQSASVINGTVEDTWGSSIFYLMTPTDLVDLAKYGVVSGYNWTLGPNANHTTQHLNIPIQSGSWDIVFLNPATPGQFGGNVTVLFFVTGIVLSSS